MKLGDTLTYTDELGATFPVKIVGMVSGSLLQGQLIVDEAAYLRKFPGAAGYRAFLLDTPPERSAAVSTILTKQLASRGLSLEPATDRLNRFNNVQNTYIGMFSVLGGIGIVLATLGLAVLALRSALERRSELGVMQAVGFTKTKLLHLLVGEQWLLHFGGLVIGLLSAILAVMPLIRSSAGGFPVTSLVIINCLILLAGLLSIWWCARIALRGPLMTAIRQE
jgi:ABC-type antimicrobial peptide transport system permease subunit